MRRNPLEWTVLLASLVAVVVLVAYLLVAGLIDAARGVVLSARVGSGAPAADGAGWLVPVTVVNDGDEAALGVVIEVSTVIDGAQVAGELTVDLVPPGGSSVSLV